MRVASDIADWWDEQHRTSKKALDAFVDEYPNWFGVFVAGTVATAMDLGGGLVDVLRLGQGAAEGSAAGFARDGLRLLQLAPALGKVGRSFLARVVVDPGGGICTWMSATKALRQVGAKTFASVDDLARAAGVPSASRLGGAFVHEVLAIVQKLGARATHLPGLSTLEQVVASVKADGVVLFSVEWLMAGRKVGHTLYAFRNAVGKILFADRTGRVVKALSELERYYPGISGARVYGSAALLLGPRILLTDGLAVLGMEIRAQLAVSPVTAAQTLEVKKMVLVSAPLPPAAYHAVQSGDSLSKLSGKYYGDIHKWPVLYEANRQIVGSNPNLIRSGQKLLIPVLPKVSAKR